jgi:hypothetical protein
MFQKQLHVYEACMTCSPWVLSLIIKIPSKCSKGSPGELRSFVLYAQTKLQEFMDRYGKMFGGAIVRYYKAGKIRLKETGKINVCDESVIVEGSTKFRRISEHFSDSVEIHGAE